MPHALTAADVTVTLALGDSYQPPGQPKVSFPTIAFGDGANTYPSYGIPLPAMGKLGMFEKAIKRIIITPPPGDGLVYKYDKTYGTIRIYEAAAGGSLTVAGASAGTPTGNVAAAALTIAAPSANLRAGALTIEKPLANLYNGTVAANTVSNLAVDVGDPTGNVANLVVDVAAPTGTLANTVVTMEALANHTHSVTGQSGAGGLVEFGSIAVAVTSLDLMVIGE